MPKIKSGSDLDSGNYSLEPNKTPYRRNFQKLNGTDNFSGLIVNNVFIRKINRFLLK